LIQVRQYPPFGEVNGFPEIMISFYEKVCFTHGTRDPLRISQVSMFSQIRVPNREQLTSSAPSINLARS
jgi:hypothetical protein